MKKIILKDVPKKVERPKKSNKCEEPKTSNGGDVKEKYTNLQKFKPVVPFPQRLQQSMLKLLGAAENKIEKNQNAKRNNHTTHREIRGSANSPTSTDR